MSVLSLILLIFGALLIGYILRSRQLKKKQFKISELRKEIVYNHAEILELQMEYVALEKSMTTGKATILPDECNSCRRQRISSTMMIIYR